MKVTKTKDVKFAGRPTRGSRYDPIFEKLRKLKAGQSLLLPLGDVPMRTAYNRITSAMRREDVQPPAGCKWSKRHTKDGHIAISAVKVK